MDWLIGLLDSNTFSSIVGLGGLIIGLFGVGFGVWQYKGANLQKEKLLEITKNSMEPVGFIMMDKYYQESQIFDRDLSDGERSAALRLIDLGILKGLPAVRGEQGERLEYSYCWTRFGQEFKKYLELDKRSRN